MKAPFSYEFINAVNSSTQPAFLKIHNTGLSWFFKKYLMQEALSIFDWKVPENWDADYFRYILMGWGFVAVIKTDVFGVIPQQCTLSGQNVFYRPTKAGIANPLLPSAFLNIGTECELIRLMPDYGSVADLVDYYGDLMALTYEGIATNILNSKLAYAFLAENQAEADSYKALYDSIASGQPAVFPRKNKKASLGDPMPWQTFTQNLSQNFIAPEMLEALQAIRDDFLTEIGIPNLSTRKKERVNLDESRKNSAETQCKALLWLDELQKCVERVKALFPECSPLSVGLKFTSEEEKADASEIVHAGAV